jgi:hypothetical protein
MSNEEETKKLLGFKESMEERIEELQQEINNLQIAIQEIDKLIVSTGFRTFSSADSLVGIEQSSTKIDVAQKETEEAQDQINVTSKDGTILGTISTKGHTMKFTPAETFEFTVDVPPFQSFLIERVLENMRKTDQERSINGELDPSEILEYDVEEEDGKIISLTVKNYGGERRLREINSSLRWTLDKMYDKIT